MEDIMEDRYIPCVDCKNIFIFTVGEQRFFNSKGLSLPKRCPDCRARRKATLVREQEGSK
jgi:hypothetical protein